MAKIASFIGHSIASLIPGSLTYQYARLSAASAKRDQLYAIKNDVIKSDEQFTEGFVHVILPIIEAITYWAPISVANQDDVSSTITTLATIGMAGVRLFSYGLFKGMRTANELKIGELENLIKEDYQAYQPIKAEMDEIPIQ